MTRSHYMSKRTNRTQALNQIQTAAKISRLKIQSHQQYLTNINCIPIPSLSLQWLIASDKWPSGQITRCTGPFTSLFDYQLTNWFLKADGIVELFNPELELNWNNITALGELPAQSQSRLLIGHVRTIKQWQTHLQDLSQILSAKTPLLTVINTLEDIDTLTSKNTLQWERNLITAHISRNPIESSCERSGITLDLKFELGGSTVYNQSICNTLGCGKTGWALKISNHTKSGFIKAITVPILTEFIRDHKTDKNHQSAVFDWDAADADFLCKQYEKIAGIIPLERKYVCGMGVNIKCTRLDINEFIPASEFGRQLKLDHEVMRLLQKELGIETA